LGRDFDRLDRTIEDVLGRRDASAALSDPELAPLAVIAAQLKHAPSPAFRARLLAQLTKRKTMTTLVLEPTKIREGFTTVTPYVSWSTVATHAPSGSMSTSNGRTPTSTDAVNATSGFAVVARSNAGIHAAISRIHADAPTAVGSPHAAAAASHRQRRGDNDRRWHSSADYGPVRTSARGSPASHSSGLRSSRPRCRDSG